MTASQVLLSQILVAPKSAGSTAFEHVLYCSGELMQALSLTSGAWVLVILPDPGSDRLPGANDRPMARTLRVAASRKVQGTDNVAIQLWTKDDCWDSWSGQTLELIPIHLPNHAVSIDNGSPLDLSSHSFGVVPKPIRMLSIQVPPHKSFPLSGNELALQYAAERHLGNAVIPVGTSRILIPFNGRAIPCIMTAEVYETAVEQDGRRSGNLVGYVDLPHQTVVQCGALGRKREESDGAHSLPWVVGMDSSLLHLLSVAREVLWEGRQLRGCLLHGLPGSGKKSLVQEMARQLQVPLYCWPPLEGGRDSDRGNSTTHQSLAQTFGAASQQGPSLLLLPHIDRIGASRNNTDGYNASSSSSSSSSSLRQLASLLSLLDGTAQDGLLQGGMPIFVVATTVDPALCDMALRRQGRLAFEWALPPPNTLALTAIIAHHLRGVPVEEDHSSPPLKDATSSSSSSVSVRDALATQLAPLAVGFTGADVVQAIREATLLAVGYLAAAEKENDSSNQATSSSSFSFSFSWHIPSPCLFQAFRTMKPSAMRDKVITVPTTLWADIGGMAEAKQELIESAEWPSKYPELYRQLQLPLASGILLYGPPGCSKTLLAKALATECARNFLAVKGPELFSCYVGDSEKEVQKVFVRARSVAPAVLFFDEIDALAGGSNDGGGTSSVTQRVISVLLSQLDGIGSRGDVMVLAATNRPDLLPPALLRPGRFDKCIYVGLPDVHARISILQIHTKALPLENGVDLQAIAEGCEGYSGAECAAICREAALLALEENAEAIDPKHFMQALQKIPAGTSTETLAVLARYRQGSQG
jgi:SpoVK/Ycf46/Vps4 family AAA+-type ATPase